MMMMRHVRVFEAVDSIEDLAGALTDATLEMGFHNFALTHHVASAEIGHTAFRVHNYPPQWVEHYDRQALVFCDPVHRASHLTNLGFPWSQLEAMIPMTRGDKAMLDLGRQQGIGDGFTVPANIPGEARGSVTFVVKTGHALPEQMLLLAKTLGDHAFAAARSLATASPIVPVPPGSRLTDRQRECVLWVARGKGDYEIAIILGLRPDTVTGHINEALRRYGVNKRTSLVIRTLLDGTITLPQIMRRRHPHFWG